MPKVISKYYADLDHDVVEMELTALIPVLKGLQKKAFSEGFTEVRLEPDYHKGELIGWKVRASRDGYEKPKSKKGGKA
jgi:hypothetical protein